MNAFWRFWALCTLCLSLASLVSSGAEPTKGAWIEVDIGLIVFQVQKAKWILHVMPGPGDDRMYGGSCRMPTGSFGRRLIDHAPEDAELFDRFQELMKFNRLDHIGIGTQGIAFDEIPFFPR